MKASLKEGREKRKTRGESEAPAFRERSRSINSRAVDLGVAGAWRGSKKGERRGAQQGEGSYRG